MEALDNLSAVRYANQGKGGVVSTWIFTFEPHDGGTRGNLTVEYTIPLPVLGKVAEAVLLRQHEQAADMATSFVKAKKEVGASQHKSGLLTVCAITIILRTLEQLGPIKLVD